MVGGKGSSHTTCVHQNLYTFDLDIGEVWVYTEGKVARQRPWSGRPGDDTDRGGPRQGERSQSLHRIARVMMNFQNHFIEQDLFRKQGTHGFLELFSVHRGWYQ